MNNEPKESPPKLLKALTSLRFFAAVMIVVHHTKGSFGLHARWLLELPTGQAVSFFFVLSGFVLAYVYKALDKPGATGKFLIARMVRIWPLHLATLLLVFLLLPAPLRTPGGNGLPAVLLANIFLVQGWIPVWDYFFSYNWLSWAISTEFAFYLLFPLVIRRWKTTWHIKTLCALLLALGTICCVNLFQIPLGNTAENTTKVGYLGLLYIGPAGRFFEFTVGMTAAALYRKTISMYSVRIAAGTIMEIIALGMVVGILAFTLEITGIINRHYPMVGEAGIRWLAAGGLPCIFFGFFILVMAMEKGLLSTRLFSGRFLTELGNMSLAIFLLHQILLRYYQWRLEESLTMPDWFVYGYYWTLLLTGSYLLMQFIEKPCRNIISGLVQTRKSGGEKPSVLPSRNPLAERTNFQGMMKNKSIITISVLLILLVPVVLYSTGPVIPKNAIDPTEAKTIIDQTSPQCKDVVFGEKFLLKGAAVIEDSDKIFLKLVWQSVQQETLRFLVAVHILNEKGEMLFQMDYPQSVGSILVKKNVLWMEKTEIQKEKLRFATNIGIVLYCTDPPTTLSIHAGPRDWQGNRLLIELPSHGKQ